MLCKSQDINQDFFLEFYCGSPGEAVVRMRQKVALEMIIMKHSSVKTAMWRGVAENASLCRSGT